MLMIECQILPVSTVIAWVHRLTRSLFPLWTPAMFDFRLSYTPDCSPKAVYEDFQCVSSSSGAQRLCWAWHLWVQLILPLNHPVSLIENFPSITELSRFNRWLKFWRILLFRCVRNVWYRFLYGHFLPWKRSARHPKQFYMQDRTICSQILCQYSSWWSWWPRRGCSRRWQHLISKTEKIYERAYWIKSKIRARN
jgi:hypothetical protein